MSTRLPAIALWFVPSQLSAGLRIAHAPPASCVPPAKREGFRDLGGSIYHIAGPKGEARLTATLVRPLRGGLDADSGAPRPCATRATQRGTHVFCPDAYKCIRAHLLAGLPMRMVARPMRPMPQHPGDGVWRIEEQTRFESNAEYDRWALYLRPLDDTTGLPVVVAGATETQERWGGLHCTLCSFAPAIGSGGAQEHGESAEAALEAAFAAARAAAGQDLSSLTFQGAGEYTSHFCCCFRRMQAAEVLPECNGMLLLAPAAAETTLWRVLGAITKAVAASRLRNARSLESLHVSCGGVAGAKATRRALLECSAWELCIAQCGAGTTSLRVTAIGERRVLRWAASHPDPAPDKGQRGEYTSHFCCCFRQRQEAEMLTAALLPGNGSE